MSLTFHFKCFFLFVLAFILFTAIGTITHELGHIAVAEFLGYSTTLYHDSMNYNSWEASEFHGFLVTLGGPLQTMLTGILGLVILRSRKNKRNTTGFTLWDWLAVFLSLFWLREVFNVVMSVGMELMKPNGTYFGGDEAGLAWYLGIPHGTFAILFALIGLFVVFYIVFKVIPRNLRLIFIAGGLIGGVMGFVIWMNHLGPLLFS